VLFRSLKDWFCNLDWAMVFQILSVREICWLSPRDESCESEMKTLNGPTQEPNPTVKSSSNLHISLGGKKLADLQHCDHV
jgi:hypothetical protein